MFIEGFFTSNEIFKPHLNPPVGVRASPPLTTTVPTTATVTATPPVTTTLPVTATPPTTAPPGGTVRYLAWWQGLDLPLLILFVAIGLAAAFSYFYLSQRVFREHRLNARLTEILALAGALASGLGLLLLGFTSWQIPLLSHPLLMNLLLAAIIGVLGYGVYFYLQRYPKMRESYELEERKKKYMPKPKAAKPSPPASPPRKKKAKKRR
ncbi:MAG: hypothetical protein HY871_00965 [Chloroflexi bacterium]|nr:hypothetical protein [Chloroflexota bacterium]MBI5955549.1 hypothetical protein [Chloroflexota bacterium]